MNRTDYFLEKIDSELNDFLKEIPSSPAGLYDPFRHMLSLGGKRLRPLLVLLGSNLFNGKIKQALPAALAVELFHNFTLVHDDIMDDAPLRRGRPTVHKKWSLSSAILCGDVMLVHAYRLLGKTDRKKLPEVLDIFNRVARQVCEGQQLDMDFEKKKNVNIGRYIKMIELKTAVLLGASLQIGAVMAGAHQRDAYSLYEFGRNLGIAFQLKDDWLDTYGDEKKTGKQKGGDIMANKKTWLLVKALLLADEAQKQRLTQILEGKEKNYRKVKAVIAIYNSLGIDKSVRNEMERYQKKAIKFLDQVAAREEQKSILRELSEQVLIREH